MLEGYLVSILDFHQDPDIGLEASDAKLWTPKIRRYSTI